MDARTRSDVSFQIGRLTGIAAMLELEAADPKYAAKAIYSVAARLVELMAEEDGHRPRPG